MRKGTFELVVGEDLSAELTKVQGYWVETVKYGPLIVHRDTRYPTKWTVSDPYTGSYITRDHTNRQAAIDAAIATIDVVVYRHNQPYERFIVNTLEKCGVRTESALKKYGKEMILNAE